MTYRVARGGNPYGVGQTPFREQGFIAHVLGCLAADREIVIWGDGSVERDFVYVADVVQALILMLDDQGAHRVYNVASGHGRSLNDIIRMTEPVTGLKARVRYEAARAADVPSNCLDISRIHRELGWEPQVDLSAGLEMAWQWINGRLVQPVNTLAEIAS